MASRTTYSTILSALVPAAASASFTPLGVVDGLKVNGISADGSYIVGQYIDLNGDKIAMRWDITGFDPLEDLGELPTGKIESQAHAASGDGSVVVGDSKVEDPNDPSKDVKEAFVWEDGVMTGLGFLEDPTVKFESVATAVSEDGLVVAGRRRRILGVPVEAMWLTGICLPFISNSLIVIGVHLLYRRAKGGKSVEKN